MVTEQRERTASFGATETAAPPSVRIDALSVRTTVRTRKDKRERVLLDDVSLAIQPGELVAIVGGSGAGKTTLLNALAGVKAPTGGRVSYNGQDLYANLATFRSALGYVPQDDIVHSELTVERTLQYAARLRLPPETTRAERDAIVRAVIEALALTAQAGQRISTLSGGQRKRTSIGVELLTKPGVLFLDEPTSGLDPATGRTLLRMLRRLAEDGVTVVLTTHAPQDIGLCDRVIVLASGGSPAFAGPPKEALDYFEVESFEDVYERVASGAPVAWEPSFGGDADATVFAVTAAVPKSKTPPATVSPRRPRRRTVGALRQWAVLSERTFETLLRNRLTLAILVGSPLMVITMFAVLFRPGAFDPTNPSPSATLMILFWVAFAPFFFGLTYGLLMICTEVPIFRRERLVNLEIAPYVVAKVTVLFPVLAAVVILMVCVLRIFDRLPAGGLELYGPLTVTLLLEGLAAIALGLLASAAVTRPEQATLALPMISFPQVLFAGAILPLPAMAGAGRGIAWFMTDKWGFEALGASVNLNELFANGASPLGPPLLAEYGTTFSGPVTESWLMLAASAAVFFALTCWVLGRRHAS
ncbi:MAG: ATP-binding cassette domain-containing protein [Dehalococcoidia bacterium]